MLVILKDYGMDYVLVNRLEILRVYLLEIELFPLEILMEHWYVKLVNV